MANVIDSLTLGGKTGVLSIPYTTCGTAAGTAAKTASVTNFSLETGAQVRVKFTYANTVANPTLNINSSGAKAIYWHGAALPSAQYWAAGAVLDFVYNGSQWELVSVANDNNTTYTLSSLGAAPAHDHPYLPIAGGTITGNLGVNGKVTQGTPSGDATVTNMNRFQADLFVEGNGSAPNQPKAAGFYLGKSASDGNRHMDIVSGDTYSYIDFNKASNNLDYDARLLVDVNTGYTQFMWDSSKSSKTLNVVGSLQQNSIPVATINDLGTTSKKSTVANTTLSASGWIGSIYEYTHSAITATNIIELTPAVGITNEQLSALQLANIIGGMQESGCIVLRVMGKTPRIDIPVTFVIRGDV